MKITFFIVFIIYASSIIADSKCNQADLILENASIYDGLSDKSFIGSIGVEDSKISFINKGKITT